MGGYPDRSRRPLNTSLGPMVHVRSTQRRITGQDRALRTSTGNTIDPYAMEWEACVDADTGSDGRVGSADGIDGLPACLEPVDELLGQRRKQMSIGAQRDRGRRVP